MDNSRVLRKISVVIFHIFATVGKIVSGKVWV
jgi:hypothetical protein